MVGALLVKPVAGNAVLRNVVHLARADLDFKRLSFAENGCVQGLVAVGLGHGDVILKAAVKRLPQRVRKSHERVAFGNGVAQNAQREKVKQFAGLLVALSHLLVD